MNAAQPQYRAVAASAGMLVITQASKEAAKLELWRLLGDGIKAHLDDAAVQEVMINNGHNIFIERNGVVTLTDLKLEPEAIEQAIITLANVNQDKASYIFDGDLPGLRFAAARPPIAINGACMSQARCEGAHGGLVPRQRRVRTDFACRAPCEYEAER
jgi:Flp pilus assembly CpaF family ATPase